jgi:hypothetical protein
MTAWGPNPYRFGQEDGAVQSCRAPQNRQQRYLRLGAPVTPFNVSTCPWRIRKSHKTGGAGSFVSRQMPIAA